MANILQNPNMGDWQHGHYFTALDGRVGTVEYPAGWEFVSTPKMEDPNRLPESLHRDNGFVISAAYISWEGGYVQRNVQLEGNQRYLAKAVFKPDVNFPGGQPVDLAAVNWQHRIVASTGETVEQGWQSTGKGELKQNEENLYVFDCVEPVTIDYYFLVRSVYAGNDCDFWVYELALETVPADYGGPDVPVIGAQAAAETPPAETVTPEPVAEAAEAAATEPAAETTPAAEIATATGPSGKSLGDVLSAHDIDQIAIGLRALAAESGASAANGLYKLAEALERLK